MDTSKKKRINKALDILSEDLEKDQRNILESLLLTAIADSTDTKQPPDPKTDPIVTQFRLVLKAVVDVGGDMDPKEQHTFIGKLAQAVIEVDGMRTLDGIGDFLVTYEPVTKQKDLSVAGAFFRVMDEDLRDYLSYIELLEMYVDERKPDVEDESEADSRKRADWLEAKEEISKLKDPIVGELADRVQLYRSSLDEMMGVN